MGSLYFQVLRMPIMAVMLLGAAFMMGYYNNFQLTKSNFNLYMGMIAALVLTSIINYKNGFRVNDLIILLANVAYIVMLQDFISFRNFTKNIYANNAVRSCNKFNMLYLGRYFGK